MGVIYRARAPLRLGLAGGGSDVSPFSDRHGGCVLNATIDLYAQAFLEPTNSGTVAFFAEDLGERFQSESAMVLPTNGLLPLYCGIYNRIVRDFRIKEPLSFRLSTYADAPAGSGLGTSSTMVVCILQVFSEWLNLGLGEYELAWLAYRIEREDLGLAGGKQDQYAAAFGGFNFMEFGPQTRVLVNPLRVKLWIVRELESSTVLYYTGTSRSSAAIITEQVKNINNSDQRATDATQMLKHDAYSMKEALLRADFEAYAEVLQRSWLSKKQLASSVTNNEMDRIYTSALDAGAIAGKLSGAGGGGVFMFFVKGASRMSVINALKQHQGQILNFHFTNTGAESWTVESRKRERIDSKETSQALNGKI
jgi:D-glycero-alpha-D-manno-heptose-7-phosphate kinase